MPPSSSLAAITWLPPELVLNVFAYLDAPLDLHHASLVCHGWHDLGAESTLWEKHYWRFYRTSSQPNEQLRQRSDRQRHHAMRVWVQTLLDAPSTDCLYPFLYSDATSTKYKPYKPFVKGFLTIIELQGLPAMAKVLSTAAAFTTKQWGPQGPDSAAEATPQLLEHLMKALGVAGRPSPSRGAFAAAHYDHFAKKLQKFTSPQPPKLGHTPLPYFLRNIETQDTEDNEPLDFHKLFIERMNSDERLLEGLQSYIHLADSTFSNTLELVNRYGDQARDLLAALAADQRLTPRSVSLFAVAEASKKSDESDRGKDSKSLRALDVHTRAATGATQPSPQSCLSLQHAARHLLSHLQRREAVRSLQKLRNDWTSKTSRGQPLRADIIDSCVGIEDALADLALFRSGDKAEIRQYLDTLALYVWSSLKAEERSLVAKGLKPANHDAALKYSLSSCTRELVTSIHGSLRLLGFGVVLSGEYYDINNNFAHLALWCPGQRFTLPFVATLITCAVARRLGVATTLVGTSDRPLAIALEDGPQPANFRSKYPGEEWDYFYIGSGFINKEVESVVMEVGLAKAWLAELGAAEDEGASVETLLKPLSPLALLKSVAVNIIGTLQEAPLPPPVTLQDVADSDQTQPPPPSSGARNELFALRAFVTGRQAQPPGVLPAPFLPSTLAFLPGTRAGTPRVDSAPARRDAKYAACLVLWIVAPHMLGGPREAEDQIMEGFLGESPEFFAADGAYRGDLALLLEINGRDASEEMKAARLMRGQDMAGAFQHPREPFHLRSILADVMAVDQQPNQGLGGAGGGPPGVRLGSKLKPSLKRAFLDPLHRNNAHVEHRVGNVFQHRVDGYYGVIIGWDVRSQLTEAQSPHIRADDLTEDDEDSPCYHVVNAHDGGHRYVPQRNIKAVRVPSGSTADDAASLLRKLVPLFNLPTVGRCFSTVQVEPWAAKAKGGVRKGKKGKKAREEEKSSEGGQVKLVMNEWMRQAWPYD